MRHLLSLDYPSALSGLVGHGQSAKRKPSGRSLVVGTEIRRSAGHGVTGNRELLSVLGTIAHPREQRKP